MKLKLDENLTKLNMPRVKTWLKMKLSFSKDEFALGKFQEVKIGWERNYEMKPYMLRRNL